MFILIYTGLAYCFIDYNGANIYILSIFFKAQVSGCILRGWLSCSCKIILIFAQDFVQNIFLFKINYPYMSPDLNCCPSKIPYQVLSLFLPEVVNLPVINLYTVVNTRHLKINIPTHKCYTWRGREVQAQFDISSYIHL